MKGHRWFAALYDVLNRASERRVLAPLRARLLGELQGLVLEIGAGTGASFPHYASAALVVAADPDPYMLRRGVKRARGLNRRIIFVRCAAEVLPFGDGAFDASVAAVVL